MNREEVRTELARRVAATSVEQVAREVGVPTMTLWRFVAGEVEQPRDPAWGLMVAAVERRGGITAAEAPGVLTAVRRLRALLDQLEHEARAVDEEADRAAAAEAITPPATTTRRRRGATG